MNKSNFKKSYDSDLLYVRKNVRTKIRIYYKRYPESRRQPDHKTFINLEKNLRPERSFKVDN